MQILPASGCVINPWFTAEEHFKFIYKENKGVQQVWCKSNKSQVKCIKFLFVSQLARCNKCDFMVSLVFKGYQL